MNYKKYISAIFVNKNVVPYQFKNIRTLRMALGCYIVGSYHLVEFPTSVHDHRASLEILPVLVLVTIFLAIPITFTSLGLSQYSKKGWIKLWDAEPVWRGIGIAGILCLYVAIMSNLSLSTYFLYYTTRSLETETPWSECDENQSFFEEGCFTYKENRSIRLDCIDMHGEEHCRNIDWKNSAQYFWESTVRLKNSRDFFHYNTNLIFYQIAVTVMIYICLRNSTESLAIFSPFLLLFPTGLHGVLLIRSFLHPGTLRGLEDMSQFKFSNLISAQFWLDFATLSIYSTGFAYGGLSNFGTQYNFRHPINIDAVFINLASVTYSIMYTILIYNIYGILSYELDIPVQEIVDIDKDDSFIQCALSFAHMPFTKFWTFIFYLANFLIVLRNLAIQCEMFLCTFYELKPVLKRYTIPCALVFCHTLVISHCVLNFNIAVTLVLEVFIWVVFVVIPALAFYFYIFISFFYGVMHLMDDMHFMLGFRPCNLWKLNWYMGFLIYLALFIFSAYESTQSAEDLNETVHYIRIVIITIFCLIPLIYFILFVAIKYEKKIPFLEIFKSAKQWGPRDEVLRKSRDMFSAHDMTKEYLYRQKKLKGRVTEVPTTRLNSE
ncbi:sodium- and chloride-dependent creatine transporter 1-like [Coccinella septempunctata]|uniref:sodium- and chloride-dependent creatine transporter 1-like n=1 Tax=Coccinella septempunctata TaxID=41139 RepID=UPI001D080845|nr:sodium- and chloride-dependent creatine transporter 1-like [Coccinella septempunctata]